METKSESYQDRLRKFIREHGQYHTIYRTKFGIIEGYKKAESLIDIQPNPLDRVSRFTNIEVDTLEEHLKLCEMLAPIRLKGSELKGYANRRAKEFLRLGIKPGRIVSLLANICHTSTSYMSRILPDEFKDLSQQRTAEQSSPKLNRKTKLISKIRERHNWLIAEDISKGLKDPLYLLELAERHFSSIRKVVNLDPIEIKKLKANFYKDTDFLRECHARYEEYLEKKTQEEGASI